MPYHGKKLRLHKDCIFVQLDEKSVVFNHKNRAHFSPKNEAARMMIDLLSKNAGKDKNGDQDKHKGTSFDDLVTQLLQTYQIERPQAEAALNEFLGEMDGFGLLEETSNSDPVPPDLHHYPPHAGDPRGHITAGGTVITTGYVITWYRP
jgi:hypothetical protein